MANELPYGQHRCEFHDELIPCPKCSGSTIVRPEPEKPKELILRGLPGANEYVMARLARAFEAVVREREFQTDKYGLVLKHYYQSLPVPPTSATNAVQGPGGHELGAWLVIIESELDEAKKALVHGGSKNAKGRDTIRAEIVQIAAVAIAALEQHGVEE